MKPGDIVVYKERAGNPENDKIKRATFRRVDTQLMGRGSIDWVVCDMGDCRMYVHPSCVIRVEPSQHDWPNV